MKQSRLDQLADGIFAIVMTLLVFEIRVPEFTGFVSERLLAQSLATLFPLFMSYLLAFALLFTYWRSHHFIASVYAKTIDIKLTNINAIFFFFVALIPFSAHFLGNYSMFQVPVLVFALNVIFIGMSLYAMRKYVEHSKNIEKIEITMTENMHAYTRILFPVFCAAVAILISIIDTTLALFLFTIGILFNLSPKSTSVTYAIIEGLLGRKIIE